MVNNFDTHLGITFWTSLIKTSDDTPFLERNCTHVFDEYWIYEGDNELLQDSLSTFEVIADGAVPSLAGMSEQNLISGCAEWFGVDISPDKQ